MSKLEYFDFTLPSKLIAQEPSVCREKSKLLIVKESDGYQEKTFENIIDYLKAGDVLVLNDSKVLKAKLVLGKVTLNLHKQISPTLWRAFARPSAKLKQGDKFFFEDNVVTITEKLKFGEVEVNFDIENIYDFLNKFGQIPLPPYIKRKEEQTCDAIRYQTVFAKDYGSVAAPTAGLHFTNELLDKIKTKGVEVVYVTLHVGAGTFVPIKTNNIFAHKMHTEYYNIPEFTAETITKAKKENRRVIAVGTTTLRTLESSFSNGIITQGEGFTNLFITQGFQFNVDILITNFHVPRSTLFVLVCAFGGYKKMHSAYKYAIESNFQFFSYGDAMMISRCR